MNSCVLMAKIVRRPELRYIAPENQVAVTDFMVEFESNSPNTGPYVLKAVAWRDLAVSVQQQYHEGDEVILTGRLKMNVFQREGSEYKEKVAELTVSHIYPLQSSTPPDNVVEMNNYQPEQSFEVEEDPEPIQGVNVDKLDDIPF